MDNESMKGITYMFLLTNLLMNGSHGQFCVEKIEDNLKKVDCSNMNITVNIPSIFSKTIQSLNLSYNTIVYIDANSLSPYSELIELDLKQMSRSGPSSVFDYNSFKNLKKLQYLDVSHSCQNDETFAWPSSLRILKIEHCYLYNEELQNLHHLEELHAAYSSIPNFPEFVPFIPLTFLDIRGCPMYSCPIKTIAPLCQLRRLALEIAPKDGIQNYINYCQCLKVNEWLEKTHVVAEKLNCTVPYTHYLCNKFEESEAEQIRIECLNQASALQSKNINSYVVTFLSVFFILIIIGSIFIYILQRSFYSGEGNEFPTTVKHLSGNDVAPEGELRRLQEISRKSRKNYFRKWKK